MSVSFEFDGLLLEISIGFPSVGSEEHDPQFAQTLLEAGAHPFRLRMRQRQSWVLARLANLTYGDLQQLTDKPFENDGNEVPLRFKVTRQGQLAGKFGIVLSPSGISFAGFSKEGFNMRELLIRVLLSAPTELGRIEVEVIDPDTQETTTYGWDRYSDL